MAYEFAHDYAEARRKFLEAATAAGGRLRAFHHPDQAGPDGGPLCVDVAEIGPDKPDEVLLVVSGTHGIEGFCGSACQISLLADDGPVISAGPATGFVFVHALNPFGFAYQRRVDDGNVDVNRNFVEHGGPASNPDYDMLHEFLLTDEWNRTTPRRLLGSWQDLVGQVGRRAVQQAVTGGQYRHPDGLFYGGTRPVWSNDTLRRIARESLAGASRVGYIDLHTGLGEWGQGEPIFRGGRDPLALQRARTWYGEALTVSEQGTSSSTLIYGNTAQAVADAVDHNGGQLTAITLEFGTLSAEEVLLALCADNWLHNRFDARQALASDLKGLVREAFSPSDPAWRTAVTVRAREVVDQALRGLTG